MGKKQQGSALPRGITVRRHKTGETLQLTFTFNGVLCREPLSGMEVNPRNIKYAERYLGEIQNRIASGDFNYLQYFPRSKKAALFGHQKKKKTVKDYLEEYLVISENRNLSPSTLDGYRKCLRALRILHSIHVTELTPAALKNWVSSQKTKLKTIRNRLSFLRSAIDEAVTDGLISDNPVAHISASRYFSVEAGNTDEYEVDPFTPDEIRVIYLNCRHLQWKTTFQFAFNTGVRPSELCALKWSDIDFQKRTAFVQNAVVEGVYKGTKTKSGTRKIELNDEALQALNDQKQFTLMKNVYVFEDPRTGEPWTGSKAIHQKAWRYVMKDSGIRYRNPYQTRHTFATMHISAGVNLFWLCKQMGHKGPDMLFRNYGSYLSDYDGHLTRPGIKTGSE
ncbi:site-specific integrase [Pantoea sp. UBA5037]|uniref:site-specific integrase n=1 Tax=Pantoea sp. UBA5037 TaxID=1947036 RepID=UPI00257FDFEB|nr:site-specific integrase [Pantoea sp. UBA5037]MDU4747759.1 tyrosine-type recombinase/integrase [Pantoea sp.]